MTVYVQSHVRPQPCYVLWGDTPDEGLLAVYAVGGDITQQRVPSIVDGFTLTEGQYRQAIAAGAVPLTPLGAIWWCARRDGDDKWLRTIAEASGRPHGEPPVLEAPYA